MSLQGAPRTYGETIHLFLLPSQQQGLWPKQTLLLSHGTLLFLVGA